MWGRPEFNISETASGIDSGAIRGAEAAAYCESLALIGISLVVILNGEENVRTMLPVLAASFVAAFLGWCVGRRGSATAALGLIAGNLLGLVVMFGTIRVQTLATGLLLAWPYARAYRALHGSSRD